MATINIPGLLRLRIKLLLGFRWLRCGKAGCNGWMNDDEISIKLQTEKCLKKGGKEVKEIDEVPCEDFSDDRVLEESVMSELNKVMPQNGRAVLLFKTKCGCPFAKMEVWSSETCKRKHEKSIEERSMSREAAVSCKQEKKVANNSEQGGFLRSPFNYKRCVHNSLQCSLCDGWEEDGDDSWKEFWEKRGDDSWDDYVMVCCICLSNYANNEELMQFPCCHFFHKKCIQKWMKIKDLLCPFCKRKVDRDVLQN